MLESDKAETGEILAALEDKVALLECDQRLMSTPVKDNLRSANPLLSPEAVDQKEGLRQKISQ